MGTVAEVEVTAFEHLVSKVTTDQFSRGIGL